MSREEGIRRMKDVGIWFTITGVSVPVLLFVLGQLGNRLMLEAFLFTSPFWVLMLIAGIVLWVTAFIKEGYAE